MCFFLFGGVLFPGVSLGHPGDLDEHGGHFGPKNSGYHYHRPTARTARETPKYLEWKEHGVIGLFRGEVMDIKRPDSVWVHIPYRPAFHQLARNLAAGALKQNEQMIEVWLSHVSPEGSVTGSRKFRRWFEKKVKYELGRKIHGKKVEVQFKIKGKGARLTGMVFLGKENINLWLVLKGWSYNLLEGGPNPFQKEFTKAENKARKNRSGLWKKRKNRL